MKTRLIITYVLSLFDLVCTLYLQSRFGERLISDEQEKAYFERIEQLKMK